MQSAIFHTVSKIRIAMFDEPGLVKGVSTSVGQSLEQGDCQAFFYLEGTFTTEEIPYSRYVGT